MPSAFSGTPGSGIWTPGLPAPRPSQSAGHRQQRLVAGTSCIRGRSRASTPRHPAHCRRGGSGIFDHGLRERALSRDPVGDRRRQKLIHRDAGPADGQLACHLECLGESPEAGMGVATATALGLVCRNRAPARTTESTSRLRSRQEYSSHSPAAAGSGRRSRRRLERLRGGASRRGDGCGRPRGRKRPAPDAGRPG